MIFSVNKVLSDPSFDQWLKNLRNLSKAELERKEEGIAHALDSKKRENDLAGLPPDAGTERLTTQLEACCIELAKCDLQTQVIGIVSGAQPFGIENPRLLGTIKCRHCPVSRLIFAPSYDLTVLTETLLETFIKRASARIIEQFTEDHRLMNRHAPALSIQVLLRE